MVAEILYINHDTINENIICLTRTVASGINVRS